MDKRNLEKWGEFKTISGLKVFEPQGACATSPSQKHPCADCHFCQMCSDGRCSACRMSENTHGENHRPKKLSIREQVGLFEAINGNGHR